jgi:hypothetical protein
MWEYRLIWTAAAPSWWERAWKNGEALFQRESRNLEGRPDTYLVLKDRPDVGLKLRGGAEEEFDVKVLHHRKDGWELWEKITFFRWNDLEVKRFAVTLQRDLPLDVTAESTPAAGVKKLLAAAGIECFVQLIEKRRMQARVDELLPDFGEMIRPSWLAELVEFRVQSDGGPVRSICLETMSPGTGAAPLEPGGALCAGYPEFLIRHLKGEI